MENIIIHSTALASTTPLLMGLNTSILNGVYPSLKNIPRYSATVFPFQFGMRVAQLGIGSAVKHTFDSPWAGFAFMGITQGAIYGHSNVAWMHMLKKTKKMAWKNCLRGSPFAAARDTISQGIPYHYRDLNSLSFAGVCATSIVATQGIHNCQTIMQTSSESLGHIDAIKKGFAKHGHRILYRGSSQRLIVMGLVNFLNREYLDKVWEVDNEL